MSAPTNATHWTPASPASSRRVYSLDRPGLALLALVPVAPACKRDTTQAPTGEDALDQQTRDVLLALRQRDDARLAELAAPSLLDALGAHDDTLDPHDLPEQLRGDEAIEGRMQTWAVLGRGTLAGGGLPVLWLCRDGEESR